jgi:hypothetical protein
MSYLDDFVAAAEQDTRVGDGPATFQKVDIKVWDNGDETHRAVFTLDFADGAKADCNLPKGYPPQSITDAAKKSGDRKKIQGIAGGIRLLSMLEEHYGIKSPAELREGSTYYVKTVKTKRDPLTGKGGFIRIVAFLPKGSSKSKVADAHDDADGPAF